MIYEHLYNHCNYNQLHLVSSVNTTKSLLSPWIESALLPIDCETFCRWFLRQRMRFFIVLLNHVIACLFLDLILQLIHWTFASRSCCFSRTCICSVLFLNSNYMTFTHANTVPLQYNVLYHIVSPVLAAHFCLSLLFVAAAKMKSPGGTSNIIQCTRRDMHVCTLW